MHRKQGRVGFSFGGDGNSGSSKVILTLDDLVFINTQVSKRVSLIGSIQTDLLYLQVINSDVTSLISVHKQKLNDESIMKSQGDMKTPHHSVSGRSYLASTPDSSNVAVFEVRKSQIQ